MSKFILKKHIELGELSDDWKDCYLDFDSPSYKEVSDFQKKVAEVGNDDSKAFEAVISFLGSLFIGGKAYNKDIVSVEKENLAELPLVVLNKAIKELTGELGPKDNG